MACGRYYAVFEFKELLDIREYPDRRMVLSRPFGGFVISQLGRIPVAGDRFELQGKRYKVIDMDENRVDKVFVSDASISEKT